MKKFLIRRQVVESHFKHCGSSFGVNVLGSGSRRSLYGSRKGVFRGKVGGGVAAKCCTAEVGVKTSRTRGYWDACNPLKRREVIGLVFGVSGLFVEPLTVNAAGLPPEQKPKLCDEACEKELENVW